MFDTPPIKEFPDDEGPWRVEWLGAVEQLPHEARIDVHLRRMASHALSQSMDVSDRRVSKIGVGQLAYLTHGSTWHAMRRDGDHALGSRVRLRNVCINDESVQLVRLNHEAGTTKDGRKLWLVPPFHYQLPKQVYQSFCLAIKHNGDPFGILVPTTEVIRFYYAPSTGLARVMFRGPLQTSLRDALDPSISGWRIVNGRRRMVVARSKRMSDNDCWILGRMLGDERAFAGANRIYDSLLTAAANRETPFAVTDFPFRGAVNWTVRAVNISTQADKPRWLVLQIERCNAPFPFDELEVVAANDGRKANPKTDRPEEEKDVAFPARAPSAMLEPDDELQSEHAPAAGVMPIVLTNPGACFDALTDRRIIKTEKEDCPYKAGQLSCPLALGQDMGTGEGTYGETATKPAEIVWDTHDEERERTRRKALEASFAALYEVVDEINKIDGASAQVRESKAVSLIPFTAPKTQRQWSWLDSTKRVPREVMIVDVVAGGRAGCVVEFRQREGEKCAMGVLVSQGSNAPSDGVLAYLLLALAKQRGVWKNVRVRPEGIAIQALRHTKPTAAELAQAIVRMVYEVL